MGRRARSGPLARPVKMPGSISCWLRQLTFFCYFLQKSILVGGRCLARMQAPHGTTIQTGAHDRSPKFMLLYQKRSYRRHRLGPRIAKKIALLLQNRPSLDGWRPR
jgi:hypothetical protein